MQQRTLWRRALGGTAAITLAGLSVIGWARPAQAEEVFADLAVTSSVQPNPAWVGEAVTLSFTVTNNGPIAAVDPALTSVLNSPFDLGFRYISASPGCEEVEQSTPHFVQRYVRCELEDLAPGASTVVSVVVAYDQLGSRACGAHVLATNEFAEDGSNAERYEDNSTVCDVVTQAPLVDLPLGALRVRLGLSPIRLTIG